MKRRRRWILPLCCEKRTRDSSSEDGKLTNSNKHLCYGYRGRQSAGYCAESLRMVKCIKVTM